MRYTSISLLFMLGITSLSAKKVFEVRDALTQPADVEWLIVGAGPAGIMSTGLLHDLGVSYDAIAWSDPEFNVGRMGEYYQTVPANNNVGQFINFINACQTFDECAAPSLQKLRDTDPEVFPELGTIVKPLQDITQYLREKVKSYEGFIKNLHFEQGLWHAEVNNTYFTARNVILAIGSHPKELSLENTNVIPLDYALDRYTLAHYLKDNETIGVFGSSHSAILILKFLTDLKAHRVMNFYRSNLVYAVDMGEWVLNAANGLKGETASWAREILEKNPPQSLIKIHSNQQNCDDFLPFCDKVIYAVGYEQNESPLTHEQTPIQYDPHTGIIAPRLFGIGVAFPELHNNHGQEEYRIGLTSFMEYAQRILLDWIKNTPRSHRLTRQRKLLEQFEQLFMIEKL